MQLGNFKLAETECITGFEMWCYTLKNISKLIEVPANFDRSAFSKVYDACEIAGFDNDKLLNFERDTMTEFDYQHDLYFSKEEGRAEGKAEGLAEGLAEGKAEVARALLASGIDMDIICKCSGLTEEQVKALN